MKLKTQYEQQPTKNLLQEVIRICFYDYNSGSSGPESTPNKKEENIKCLWHDRKKEANILTNYISKGIAVPQRQEAISVFLKR